MSRARWSRSAFTLVEVLIVIAIIGMLAGMGTVAIRKAISSARRAAIFTEMEQLNQALNIYKEQTREYPPAFADTNANGENDYSVKKRFIQHLVFAFPQFNPEPDPDNSGDLIERQYSSIREEVLANYRVRTLNGNTYSLDLNNLVLNQNGNSQAEALAFWLGGLPTPLDSSTNNYGGDDKPMSSRVLAGFNADGTNPFRYRESFPSGAAPNVRRDIWTSKRKGQLFTFDVTRFIDRDDDGWPEYYPELGLGSDKEFKIPYAYFDYRSYTRAGAGANAQTPTAPANTPGYRPFLLYDASGAVVDSVVPYARSLGANQGASFASGSDIEWMGERTFQILCAGLDGKFSALPSVDGRRIFSLLPNTRPNSAYPGGAYMTDSSNSMKSGLSIEDNDNLTSFSTSQVSDILIN